MYYVLIYFVFIYFNSIYYVFSVVLNCEFFTYLKSTNYHLINSVLIRVIDHLYYDYCWLNYVLMMVISLI